MYLKIGELVYSPNDHAFHGIGKLQSVNPESKRLTVCFFRSPLEPEGDAIEVPASVLKKATLYDEQVVYCRNPTTNYWQRARYAGTRPSDEHLVIFRSGDSTVIGIDEIYAPCMPLGQAPNPVDFLKARCTDTPHFSEWRIPFIRSYIEQRAHCRSIGSIPSSSIELEKHQLAVVRRVLQDEKKKYLLADEVGLGKTIEAALILREQLLGEEFDTKAVVGVPSALVTQWEEELRNRFHLSEMFDRNLFIVAHDELSEKLVEHHPDIVVIDEAHQLSSWAWSENVAFVSSFKEIAKATHNAETCLLLSGTPLIGNEVNFLAMLHLLSPDEYELDSHGIEKFKIRVLERERLGGIYQAFVPENDNGSLEDLLDQLDSLFPHDKGLIELVNVVRPCVDFFSTNTGDDREQAIIALRKYIGEHYRLHQRMLRNRRDDPSVIDLFPGLGGDTCATYQPKDEPYCLEQYLDEFRALQNTENWTGKAITKENYCDWVIMAFNNPFAVGTLATKMLNRFGDNLASNESEVLLALVDLAPTEQDAKDQALLDVCKQIWVSTPKARLVVFCGEQEIADHVYQLLHEWLGMSVERHLLGNDLQFATDESIRVLVCDRSGEDGLNLNGGKKIAVHYDLPTSLHRIEQRLGRLNRYSSAIYAAPVKSVTLVPTHGVFSQVWLSVLDQAIEIFNRSVASLQYVLEVEIETTWSAIVNEGPNALIQLKDRLTGEDGIVARESKRVRVQEELNKLEADIQIATAFAEELEAGDDLAEQHVKDMTDWITRALLFQLNPGDFPNTFRFKYQPGVLMDVRSFLQYCYPALDKYQSNPTTPVTVQMSASREIAAQGRQVHPMRFGSPFVDVIYRFMSDDPRGIATAFIRYLDNVKLDEPHAFLGVTCLVSKTDRNTSRARVRQADEQFPPRIMDCWVDSHGSFVDKPSVIKLLERPYQKTHSLGYRDLNIRSERWDALEEYFPKRHWSQTVDTIVKNVETLLQEQIHEEESLLNIEWLSTRFVVLVGVGE